MKRWSKAEIADLERHASNASLDELAKKLNTDTKTVELKLAELGLKTGGVSESSTADVESYSKALELLYAKDWAAAKEIMERLVSESDNRQLADRARQGLGICERELGSDAEADDPYLAAVVEKNRGNFDAALELCSAEGKEEDDERFAYLMASLHSLAGAPEKALAHLETAIRLEPKNRIHAYHDPDFAELRGQDDFSQLIAADSEAS